MKTFPPSFTIEKNRTDGPHPIWILRLTVGGTDYYLSDLATSILPYSGSSPWPAATTINTLAWVKSWGSIQEGISGALGEFHVSDFSLTALIDPVYPTNMETLVTNSSLEQSPVELYQWFYGNNDPPQRIFKGRIRDVGDLTDTTVSLSIQDESILLEKCYIGRKVTLAAYPQAAASDVGKVVPIPFGSISKAPSLALAGCIQTLLTVACAAADTTIYLTSTANISAGMSFLIEAELVYISSVGSYTATVTRGYSGTTAAAHTKGAPVVQYATQIYAAADRAVTSINRVWLRLSDDLDLDITAYITRYNGQAWDYLTGYPAMAVSSITPSGMAAILDIIQLRQQDTIGVDTGNHDHAVQLSRTQVASNAGVQYGGSTSTSVTVTPTYPSVSGIVEQTNTYRFSYGGNTSAKNVYVNGNLIQSGYSSSSGVDWSGTTVGLPNIVVTSGDMNVTVTILSAQRSVVYDSTTTAEPAAGVAKTGSAQMTGSAMTSYFGSGKVFMDLTSDSGSAEGICNWILSEAGFSSLRLVGSLPISCAYMGGLIQDYQTALYWLNLIAFQSGCWFVVGNGVTQLIVRPVTDSVKTVSACLIDENGVRQLSRSKTDQSDILNAITVLFDRDWSQDRSDTAYRQATTPVVDSSSQSIYGVQERPELFQFDFVPGAAMAAYVAALYLSECAYRRWLASFTVPLMHSELEFGDLVTLGFLGVSGTVIAAEHAPGDTETQDSIKLTVRY